VFGMRTACECEDIHVQFRGKWGASWKTFIDMTDKEI